VLFGVDAAIVACQLRRLSDTTGDGSGRVSRAGLGAFGVSWMADELAVLAGGLSLVAVGARLSWWPSSGLAFGGLEFPGLALAASLPYVYWTTIGRVAD
jgi:hypothetical protein